MTRRKGEIYASEKRVYSGSPGRSNAGKTPHSSMDVNQINELFVAWGILGERRASYVLPSLRHYEKGAGSGR